MFPNSSREGAKENGKRSGHLLAEGRLDRKDAKLAKRESVAGKAKARGCQRS